MTAETPEADTGRAQRLRQHMAGARLAQAVVLTAALQADRAKDPDNFPDEILPPEGEP